jgi:hypothetical protein
MALEHDTAHAARPRLLCDLNGVRAPWLTVGNLVDMDIDRPGEIPIGCGHTSRVTVRRPYYAGPLDGDDDDSK